MTTLLRAIDSVEGASATRSSAPRSASCTWFEDVDTNPDHHYIATTIDKETPEVKAGNKLRALEDFYKRMRPGDPPTLENARTLVNSLFFNAAPLRPAEGRPLQDQPPPEAGHAAWTTRILTVDDIKGIIRELIRLNNGIGETDEIDHLGNRRVRAVGELIQNQFRIGLLRMERVVRERMTITDPDQATPSALINIRPVVAAMKEFFGGSQLSQFMDQTNPLAELTHKRKLSALGPGGLSRDHAGFDVRDVHHSHYGRICPIETPEGPNIGLIVSLASYAVINDYGFIETPYRRVIRELPADSKDLLGRIVREDVVDGKQDAGQGRRRGHATLSPRSWRRWASSTSRCAPTPRSRSTTWPPTTRSSTSSPRPTRMIDDERPLPRRRGRGARRPDASSSRTPRTSTSWTSRRSRS